MVKTYKFESRAQTLRKADVRVVAEMPETEEVTLLEELQNAGDCSHTCQVLKEKMKRYAASLPLMLYNVKHVVSLLFEALPVLPKVSLRVFKVLARELRGEFAHTFAYEVLPKLLETAKHTELLESLFGDISVCLKYLIKSLPSIDVLLPILLPFLTHPNEHVQRLSAQCFSYLVKKAPSDSLRTVVACQTADLSQLFYYACLGLHCTRLLNEMNSNGVLVERVMLRLIFHSRQLEEVWGHCLQTKLFQVLGEWVRLCNYTRLPPEFEARMGELIRQEQALVVAKHWVRANPRQMTILKDLFEGKTGTEVLDFIGEVSDFDDPHTEIQVHQWLFNKEMRNSFVCLNFHVCVDRIYEGIQEALNQNNVERGRKALGMLLWLRKKHIIDCNPVDIQPWLKRISTPEDIWLGLRASNELSVKLTIPTKWRRLSDEISTEIAFNDPPDVITATTLPAAARLGLSLPSALQVLPYLAHPILRRPACELIKSLSPALALCWELVGSSADLDNERNKFLAMKKLQLMAGSNSEAVVVVLLGVFWERFTTLWKYVNETLAEFAPYNDDFLWREIEKVLTNPDFQRKPHYPIYEKLVDEPDFTPPATYKECLLRFLSDHPTVTHSHIPAFIALFQSFVTDYVSHYYVIGFSPTPQEKDLQKIVQIANCKTGKRPELNRRLVFFLKIIKEIPDFSSLEKEQIAKISEFCTQLLLKKFEEVRVLAVDCLLKLHPQSSEESTLLRSLAKDESFKTAAIEHTGSISIPAIFLSAGRVYRKCPFTSAALSFLAKIEDLEQLTITLPIDIRKQAKMEALASCPIKRLSPVLRTVSTLASRLPHFLGNNLPGTVQFLLSVLDFSGLQGDMFREVTRLTLAALTALLSHFPETIAPTEVRLILNHLDKSIKSLETDWKPRVMSFLHLVLSRYRWVAEERTDLLHCYLLVIARAEVPEAVRTQGFALLCDYIRDMTCAPLLVSETDLITAAVIAKVKGSGLNAQTIELAQMLPVTPSLRELVDLIAPLAVKKLEVVDLLSLWLPQIPDYPMDFFIRNISRQRRLLRLLAETGEEPLRSILSDLDAKIRAGLYEIDDFTVQLEALYRAHDICLDLSLTDQKTLVSSLNHFIVKSELAKRVQSAKILVKLVPVKELQGDILAVIGLALKRCVEDEEVRTVLQVMQAYCEVTGCLETTWGDFRLIDSICHIQVANRVKGIKKLCEMTLTEELKIHIFIPFVTYLVFNFSESRHNQQSYTHALLTLLGKLVQEIPWKRYFTLLKIFSQRLKTSREDKLLARALAAMLEALTPEACKQHQTSLTHTILPVLKAHIVDRQEGQSPNVRKYIVLAVFRYITKLASGEHWSELSRLTILITRFIKHRDSGTRESAINCVSEILKTGLLQAEFMRGMELHLSDDREMLAKLMTKVVIVLPHLASETAKIATRVLLEYDQPQAFYSLAKLALYEDLPLILTSTKPLQFIAKGLSENTNISPYQMVELGLDMMEQSALKAAPIDPKLLKKDLTFCVQLGAATGTRPESSTGKKVVYSDKIFAIRLIKQGVHKAKNVTESLANRCIAVCCEGLNHASDEVVMTSLEVLRAFKSPLGIDKALLLGEMSSGDVLIQALKYLSAVLKIVSPSDSQEKRALILTGIGLESEASQSAALKLLRIFMEKSTMDPGIYDAMEQVPKLMLTNSTLRDSAANLYIDFLRSYPLSEQRRDFHIDFLIRNVEFPISTGRFAVAKAINLLLRELSTEGLAKQYDFIMLALITALANEDSEECQQEFEAALARVIELNPGSTVLSRVTNWVYDERIALQKAALVTLRIVIELGKEVKDLSTIVSSVLRREDLSTECRIHALNLLEKALELGVLESTEDLINTAQETIQLSIAEGKPCSLRSLVLLNSLSTELAKDMLRYIARTGHILPNFEELVLISPSESLMVFCSTLIRKQLGRGDQGSGTLFITHLLINLQRVLRSSHASLFKAIVVGADLAKTEEMKQAVGILFQEMHNTLPAEEFLSVYNATKASIQSTRTAKRTALKQLIVSNPEA